VSNGPLDFQNVLELVELIKSSSNFCEIRLRSGDVEVELRRHGAASPIALPAAPAASAQASPPSPQMEPAQAPGARAPSTSKAREGAVVMRAPMVGTVYRAPEPGAEPFVKVGQTIAPGNPVCIIEVMKLMNSIAAECAGVVSEILVNDGELVQYGQELFVISPR
jgi:acetyl-CoA carboxylase biotin carboxyl carrier protein